MTGAAALIEVREEGAAPLAQRLCESLSGPVVLSAQDPPLPERAPRLRIDLGPPNRVERRALWQDVLGEQAPALGPGLERLAEQFLCSSTNFRQRWPHAISPGLTQ